MTRLTLSRRDLLKLAGASASSITCSLHAASGESTTPVRSGSVLQSHQPRMAIVGIGTVGVSLLGRLREQRLRGVEYIAIDADKLVREAGAAGMRRVIGHSRTRGLCFGRHEIDTRAAAARRDEIVRALGDADLVLLIGGLGGRTSWPRRSSRTSHARPARSRWQSWRSRSGSRDRVASARRTPGCATLRRSATQPWSFRAIGRLTSSAARRDSPMSSTVGTRRWSAPCTRSLVPLSSQAG